jgi:hypothetical protein
VWKRSLAAAAAAGLLFTQAASAEAQSDVQVMLDAYVATCRIKSSTGDTQAFLAKRDHGERSKSYKTALDKAYAESSACVEQQKRLAKPVVRDAIEKTPELKPQILETYSKWMSYMDWLTYPHDLLEDPPEARNYKDASNRLKAELELR